MQIYASLLICSIIAQGSLSAFISSPKTYSPTRLLLSKHTFKNEQRTRHSSSPSSCLFSVRDDTSEEEAASSNVQLPVNEFSRPYRTDVILGPKRRDYSVSIKANEDERKGLAERFSLTNIAKLEADLILQRDMNSGGRNAANRDCIKAEGTVTATVTQTCVRTNENFDVDVEFNLFAAVRPVSTRGAGEVGGMDVAKIEGSFTDGGRQRKNSRKANKGVRGTDRRQLDEMGMKELQDLLMDFDLEEDIIEDEAVFSSKGVLDVGELVAQLFRLKLDPYPKKPGSKPINISYSG